MKPVSDQLFTFENGNKPGLGHERCSARDLGLDESWLRDSIFHIPDLVIGPCRAAGLTEDEWYPWQREYKVGAGQIDVLLLSSQGRVAVVETKLATNPELRRQVLAQALDYLTHLADKFDDAMPEIPKDESGQPVADREDILESVAQGDMLVIIASDQVDPRVAKLSRSLLSNHLVKQWDLALIDVALYRPVDDAPGACMVVPHLRNLIESEPRQVVRVVVEGETPSARVEVERITGDEVTSARQKWDEKRFFDNLEAENAPASVRELASNLRNLARSFPQSVRLAWGTGKDGSMVLKRHNGGLIEVYGSGKVKFRPHKFARALGEQAAEEYRRGLEEVVPAAMRMEYPRLPVDEAARAAPALFELIRRTLRRVEGIEG
ncbi:MAG: hypothetical protein K6T59_12575 [Bryobacteraceae bacterium]|nr:hypothetical protein [Bryobacteraceae bacterium]